MRLSVLCLLLLLNACSKQEKIIPPNPITPTNIKIAANVAPVLYSNIKQVVLDASSMTTSYPAQQLQFYWVCTNYPTGKIPSISNASSATAIAYGLDSGKYTFVIRVRDMYAYYDSAVFGLIVYPDTLKGAPKLSPLPDITVTTSQTVNLDAGPATSLNPINRELRYKWRILDQPTGSPVLSILPDNAAITEIIGMLSGNYFFSLSVSNELQLSTIDTFKITVN